MKFSSKPVRATCVTFVSLALTSCTTIVNGFNDTFEIKTEPPGAKVTTTLSGETAGCDATPCTFDVSRKDSFIAIIEKPGFHTVRIVVRSSEFVRAEIDDVKALQAESRAAGILASDVAMMVSSAAFTAHIGSGGFATIIETVWGGANGGLAAFYGAPITAGIDTVTGSQLSLYPNPVSLILIPDTYEVPDAYRVRRTPEDELVFTNLNLEDAETENAVSLDDTASE